MLLLDAGNSRLKWAYIQNGVWLHRGTLDIAALGALPSEFAGLPAPARILASNVAGEDVEAQIRAACAPWGSRVEFAQAARAQCGVHNAYHAPEQLGSDRWAALVAAWDSQHAACLVVNCGTATTVDALSVDGRFLGGLILPGLEMMRHSLVAGTAQLEGGQGSWEDFPRDTANAIYSGALQATAGAIMRQHALLGDPHAVCLLGGGAAGMLEPHLGLPLLRMDDLVLRGLQLISQEAGRIRDQ